MRKIMIMSVADEDETLFDQIKEFIQKRAEYSIAEINPVKKLSFGELTIDIYHRQVLLKNMDVNLTDLEFRLLLYLSSQPGRVFTYRQIYEAVWGEDYAYEKGNIMSHIRHIRQKIHDSELQCIENVRGVGYRFKKQ